MDVNEHDRLSNFTHEHKFNTAVLYFTVTVGSSIKSKINILNESEMVLLSVPEYGLCKSILDKGYPLHYMYVIKFQIKQYWSIILPTKSSA